VDGNSFDRSYQLQLTVEELSAKLAATEAALIHAELMASVAHRAAEAMHEAHNPLEILTNLHYLTNHTREDPQKVMEYMELAEEQARRLLEIITRVVRLHKAATEDRPKKFVM
jgi:hypothetical protein